MSWMFLLLAGGFEIGFTTCLKLSNGFTKILPSVLFVVFAVMSFWLLTKSLRTIELGTAYAVSVFVFTGRFNYWLETGIFGLSIEVRYDGLKNDSHLH